jgi:hypothetical protein
MKNKQKGCKEIKVVYANKLKNSPIKDYNDISECRFFNEQDLNKKKDKSNEMIDYDKTRSKQLRKLNEKFKTKLYDIYSQKLLTDSVIGFQGDLEIVDYICETAEFSHNIHGIDKIHAICVRKAINDIYPKYEELKTRDKYENIILMSIFILVKELNIKKITGEQLFSKTADLILIYSQYFSQNMISKSNNSENDDHNSTFEISKLELAINMLINSDIIMIEENNSSQKHLHIENYTYETRILTLEELRFKIIEPRIEMRDFLLAVKCENTFKKITLHYAHLFDPDYSS